MKYVWLRRYKIPLRMEKPERFYRFCERFVLGWRLTLASSRQPCYGLLQAKACESTSPGFEYKTDPLGVVNKVTVFSGDIDTVNGCCCDELYFPGTLL